MTFEKKVGFIGGGRITRILLEGFEKKGLSFQEIYVSDINSEILKQLKERFPAIKAFSDNSMLAAASEVIFMALHPPGLSIVLDEIKSSLKQEVILISLAPKITMAKISTVLGGFNRIVRMIPNAPSIVNAGYNPVVFGAGLSAPEKEELLALFSSLGECPEVKEETLEAYAILTAMGPTYFWFQLAELAKLGEAFGVSTKESRRALLRMIEGAAKTLFDSSLTAEEVMDLVPVKPLAEDEPKIREIYRLRLEPLYQKLKP